MSFKKILLISIIIILAFSTAGFGCKKRKPKPSNNTPVVANLPANQPINNQVNLPVTTQPPKPATEEEKVIAAAESFLRGYGSYQLGNFSNIESLYPQMTERYKDEMAFWVAEQKQKYALEPKRYITFTISILESSVISLESNQAELKIKTKRTEIKGAAIPGEGTIIWVDEFGNKPEGQVPRREFFQDAEIKLIKENDKWRINKVKFL